MAAFINRGGGRANMASASNVVVNSTLFQTVASLQMSAGATANGGGFVVVWAAWQGDPATPAPLTTQLRDTSGGGADSTDIVETASEAERVSGAVTWVFAIPADATRT